MPTDTERLDWLLREIASHDPADSVWSIRIDTPDRAAIDAAMEAESDE